MSRLGFRLFDEKNCEIGCKDLSQEIADHETLQFDNFIWLLLVLKESERWSKGGNVITLVLHIGTQSSPGPLPLAGCNIHRAYHIFQSVLVPGDDAW